MTTTYSNIRNPTSILLTCTSTYGLIPLTRSSKSGKTSLRCWVRDCGYPGHRGGGGKEGM